MSSNTLLLSDKHFFEVSRLTWRLHLPCGVIVVIVMNILLLLLECKPALPPPLGFPMGKSKPTWVNHGLAHAIEDGLH